MLRIKRVFSRFPKEAEIIGRILAGYGELEFDLSTCLAPVVDPVKGLDEAATCIKVVFRTQGEERRIQIADALMRPKYHEAGLASLYDEAIADMSFCRKIRNQYAHCHWSPFPGATALAFTNLDEYGKATTDPKVPLRYLTVPLLEAQEEYFCYVEGCLLFLAREYLKRIGLQPVNEIVMPKKEPRPQRYMEAPV